MDESVGPKLGKWLVSAMTLLLGTVSASIATLLGPWCTSKVWTCIGLSAEPLVIFLLLLPILAFWHALDLVQGRRPAGRIAISLAGYPLFLGVLSLLLGLFALNASGHFHATYCVIPEPGTFAFDGCETRPPRLLTIPLYLLLLFVVILCMGKAVISIRSRLKKAA